MSDAGNGDDKVGYKRPPKATRFQTGRSGNPKGRPKEAKNGSTIWKEELNAKVRITENGKPKRISKRRAMIRQAANKAASGDFKAIALVEAVARDHEAASNSQVTLEAGVFDRSADALTMANIVERVLLTHGAPGQPTSAEVTPEFDASSDRAAPSTAGDGDHTVGQRSNDHSNPKDTSQ